MKKIKVLRLALLALISGAALYAESPEKETIVSVMTYTDGLEEALKNYRTPDFPDVMIESNLVYADRFPYVLRTKLDENTDVPDLVLLEQAFVREFAEKDCLLPLDDIYEEIKDYTVGWQVQLASYNGHVYGLSYAINPCVMVYRRSLAKKYLGTDNPSAVQEYVSSLDRFHALARIISKASEGKCSMVCGEADLYGLYMGSRKSPWIAGDKLVIDPQVVKYLKDAKSFREEGLSAGMVQWSEGWIAGMMDTLRDANGQAREIFCYMMPKWGVDYVIKPNNLSAETAGDWAVCEGPAAWYWGGDWLSVPKNSRNPEAAKAIIRYMVSDRDFMLNMARDANVVSNVEVQNAVKDSPSFEDSFLGGQNPYGVYCSSAGNVNGTLFQSTDARIETIFWDCARDYFEGKISLEQTLEDFKNMVSMQLGFYQSQ